MSLLAIFGIGMTELIILLVCFGVIVLPLVIAGVVIAIVASNRRRDDRQK